MLSSSEAFGRRRSQRRAAVFIASALVAVSAVSCEDPEDPCPRFQLPDEDFTAATIAEGVAGYVWFWKGNFAPSVCIGGTVTPVVRTLLVFPALADSQQVWIEDYFFNVLGTPIDSVASGSDGFYQIELPPGEYSLYVREDTLLYFFGPNAATVQPDSVFWRHVDIKHEAVG